MGCPHIFPREREKLLTKKIPQQSPDPLSNIQTCSGELPTVKTQNVALHSRVQEAAKVIRERSLIDVVKKSLGPFLKPFAVLYQLACNETC